MLGRSLSNEFRVAWSHRDTFAGAQDPAAEEIPSLEIAELNMVGFTAASSRTAIGLPVNQPNVANNDLYQIQNTLTYLLGNHLLKAGLDVRHTYVKSSAFSMIRGLLRYDTLQNFVLDLAETTTINKPLPGGQEVNYYRWWDQSYFVQDEWRLHPSLTLNLGLRYELPGNNLTTLIELNERVLAASGNDAVFRLPVPRDDRKDLEPRVGFNWVPATSGAGITGFLTGGDRLSLRGGYARTHDYAFLTIAQNIASSFPYVAAITRPNLANAFTTLQNTPAGRPRRNGSQPPDAVHRCRKFPLSAGRPVQLRGPAADRAEPRVQDRLRRNVREGSLPDDRRQPASQVLRHVMYDAAGSDSRRDPMARECGEVLVRLDADGSREATEPRSQRRACTTRGVDTSTPRRTSSIRRAARSGWPRIRSTPRPIEHPRPTTARTGSPATSSGSCRSCGRSRESQGRSSAGWQVGSFFTFQSGAPFTPLNGSDPTGALSGIDSLIGNAIRPNLNTELDLSTMTIPEIIAAGGAAGPASLFRRLCGMPSAACPGERVGNAPRNLLRADGIGNVDFSLIKNTRLRRSQNLQIRVEMFNATNTRNFGIPDSRVNSAGFLNQWATDGGARKIWAAVRYTF